MARIVRCAAQGARLLDETVEPLGDGVDAGGEVADGLARTHQPARVAPLRAQQAATLLSAVGVDDQRHRVLLVGTNSGVARGDLPKRSV